MKKGRKNERNPFHEKRQKQKGIYEERKKEK